VNSVATKKLQTEAWNKALEACGTQAIFARRAAKIKKKNDWKNFLGIFVPAGVGLIVMSVTLVPNLLAVLIGITAIPGLVQLYLSIMALVQKWDDEYVSSLQSVRDNNKLCRDWEDFAKGNGEQTEDHFRELNNLTKAQEGQDLSKTISEEEKSYGMRFGLRQYQRQCATCGEVPTSLEPSSCGTCGNF